MKRYDEVNFTVYEHLFHRHWCPLSQPFATGDALLTLLDRGWQLVRISREYHGMSMGRYTIVYTFSIAKEDNRLRLPIVDTPTVRSLAQRMIPSIELIH